jgi:hypothetical protein
MRDFEAKRRARQRNRRALSKNERNYSAAFFAPVA